METLAKDSERDPVQPERAEDDLPDQDSMSPEDVTFLQAMEAMGAAAEKEGARRRSVKSGPPELEDLPAHESEDALFEAHMRLLERDGEPLPEADEARTGDRPGAESDERVGLAEPRSFKEEGARQLHGSARSLARRLRRGEIRPARELDLHGKNRADAVNALDLFLRRAQADGHELVLVVTGRGLHSRSLGVLREFVPLLLNQRWPTIVRQVVKAPRALGGEGAFAVFLRRLAGVGSPDGD